MSLENYQETCGDAMSPSYLFPTVTDENGNVIIDPACTTYASNAYMDLSTDEVNVLNSMTTTNDTMASKWRGEAGDAFTIFSQIIETYIESLSSFSFCAGEATDCAVNGFNDQDKEATAALTSDPKNGDN